MTNKGLFGRQLPDDSTLENMRKSELIELLHIAEHNHSVLVEAYNNVVTNSRCNSCLLVENNRQLREKLAAGAGYDSRGSNGTLHQPGEKYA